jgi:hypothetical protein
VAYAPPDRGTFRAILYRSLRDPSGQVFPAATVNDFITEAMMDLGYYRPHETVRTMAWDEDTIGPDITMMDDVIDVWQVVARIDDTPVTPRPTLYIPHADYATGRAGWDVVNHQLRLSRFWIAKLQQLAKREENLSLQSYGYGPRALPSSDASIMDWHDMTDQFVVTQHCKMLGFQMLNADRALYQQWLAATNNTDVSPTQLAGMLNQSEGAFDRARHRATLVRRVPSNAAPVWF